MAIFATCTLQLHTCVCQIFWIERNGCVANLRSLLLLQEALDMHILSENARAVWIYVGTSIAGNTRAASKHNFFAFVETSGQFRKKYMFHTWKLYCRFTSMWTKILDFSYVREKRLVTQDALYVLSFSYGLEWKYSPWFLNLLKQQFTPKISRPNGYSSFRVWDMDSHFENHAVCMSWCGRTIWWADMRWIRGTWKSSKRASFNVFSRIGS